MEICTLHYVPFVMGGDTWQPMKTTVEEFERIAIGHGYYGLLVKNPVKNLWHMVQEDCGCLIGTDKSRANLIKMVKKDVATGDKKVMKEQIKQGLYLIARATRVEPKEFFSKFKEQ
jgi:hypothetical protein